MSDFRTEDLHRAGKPAPITFDAPALDAPCAGRFHPNLRSYGVCSTCTRPRRDGIEPAARITQGHAQCLNHMNGGGGAGAHAESVGANPNAAQTAKQGAPIGVSPSPSAQKERA